MKSAHYTPANAEADRLYQKFCTMRAFAYSLASVADHVRVAKSTLIGWKQRADPCHGEGERLIELWGRVTGQERNNLPTVAPWRLAGLSRPRLTN